MANITGLTLAISFTKHMQQDAIVLSICVNDKTLLDRSMFVRLFLFWWIHKQTLNKGYQQYSMDSRFWSKYPIQRCENAHFYSNATSSTKNNSGNSKEEIFCCSFFQSVCVEDNDVVSNILYESSVTQKDDRGLSALGYAIQHNNVDIA